MKKLFLTFIATVFIMLAVNKTTTFAQESVKLPDFQGIDEVFFINECKAYSLGLLRNVGSAKNVLALINPSSQDLLALNSIQKVLQAELMNLVADATLPGALATFKYDDEGTPAQRVDIVKEGV